jgi:hypothetical protein
MEPCPYGKDERLKVISVDPPYVVVEGMQGAHHRARCIPPSHESLGTAPLQPGDLLAVKAVRPSQAVVERMTPDHRDGGQYLLREFQRIAP